MSTVPPAGRHGEDTVPDPAPAVLRTLGAALLAAGLWIGLAGPLNVTWGMLAVAVFAGWLIGSVTRVRRVAVAGALLAWLFALAGIYLYSLATLPGLGPAGSSLGERIGTIPITTFYAQQFGPVDALEALAIVAAAWWSAR